MPVTVNSSRRKVPKFSSQSHESFAVPCLYGKFSPRRGGGHESIIQAYYSHGLYFFEPCGKFHNKLPGTRSFRCAGLNNSPGGLKRTVLCATSRNIRASFVYMTETTAIFKTPVSSINILKLQRLNKYWKMEKNNFVTMV